MEGKSLLVLLNPTKKDIRDWTSYLKGEWDCMVAVRADPATQHILVTSTGVVPTPYKGNIDLGRFKPFKPYIFNGQLFEDVVVIGHGGQSQQEFLGCGVDVGQLATLLHDILAHDAISNQNPITLQICNAARFGGTFDQTFQERVTPKGKITKCPEGLSLIGPSRIYVNLPKTECVETGQWQNITRYVKQPLKNNAPSLVEKYVGDVDRFKQQNTAQRFKTLKNSVNGEQDSPYTARLDLRQDEPHNAGRLR